MVTPRGGTGSPSDWNGSGQKSIQESKYEIGLMANFALWLPADVEEVVAAMEPAV